MFTDSLSSVSNSASAPSVHPAAASDSASAPPVQRIADLHIHSHYSRATSKDLDFEHLAQWAQLKGVEIVATGDISHPGWLQEIRDKLEPAEEGLFRLKPDLARIVQVEVPQACHGDVRFLLGGEISNIYKRPDPTARTRDENATDVRKVHNLIFAPSLDAVEKIQIALEKIGNIRADGRPILGLDSRDLLELILTADADCTLIPAHIWTPWFSMLGSKSGFDSVEACFGDLTSHIFALETGLSSDPPMNWRVSNLDGYTLVSNSDAHSPQKLAREATIFHCDRSYGAIFQALRSGDPQRFGGTIEFFPEEGKYHSDGHRKCGVCWSPIETLARGGKCSVCGKPVTVGVAHRVERLADRPPGSKPARTHPYASLIPLPEILAEIHTVGAQSRRVQREYHRLLDVLGPELVILRRTPIEEIRRAGGDLLAEGIDRMRRGHVLVQGGYDGEYGVIKVLAPELGPATGHAPQLGLFGGPESSADPNPMADSHAPADTPVDTSLADAPDPADNGPVSSGSVDKSTGTGTQSAGVMQADSEQATQSAPGADSATLQLPRSSQDRPARNTLYEVRNGVYRAAPLLDDADFMAEEDLAARYSTGQGVPISASAESAPGNLSPVPGTYAPGWQFVPLFLGEDVPPPPAADTVLLPEPEPWAQLNAEQAAAVQHTQSHLLIVAGPGTGKTHTLTTRIAYLVQARQAAPESILAITFTNKAAEELRTRLAARLGESMAQRLSVQTFHALCADLLRIHGHALAGEGVVLAPDFAIADSEMQTVMLAAALPTLGVRARAHMQARISDLKNRLAVPAAEHEPELAHAYAAYMAQLQANGLVDYDDLIALTVQLLESVAAVRSAVQARYRWISVDEYQDVNAAQVRLLRLLTGSQTNVCAIGDPDQAIYGFRGADYRHFYAFEQDFPGAAVYTLQRNYRSPQTLLTAARQVIAKNPNRMAVELWSDFAQTVQVDVYQASSARAEAEYIGRRIEQMVGGTSHFALDSGWADSPGTEASTDELDEAPRTFGEFAVLVRLHAQIEPLAAVLERSGIPYQVIGGVSLYAHADMRWLLAALQWGANPRALLSLVQLCAWDATPTEQGRMHQALVTELGEAESGTYAEKLAALVNLAAAWPGPDGALGNRVATRARLLARFWPSFLPHIPGADPQVDPLVGDALTHLCRFSADLRAHFPPLDETRIAHLQARAQSYGRQWHEFLAALALTHPADFYDARADRVTLMTLHAAKGLEFPVVFMAGCEEGLLPYLPSGAGGSSEVDGAAGAPEQPEQAGEPMVAGTRTADAEAKEAAPAESPMPETISGTDTEVEARIEEERRLFYVGMTRAQARLILTHATRRQLFGRTAPRTLSRFVNDIEAALKTVSRMVPRPPSTAQSEGRQLSLF